MFTPIIKNNITEDISILVKQSNNSFNYICECGEASRLSIKEIQQTEVIFISHTHIDHFANFDQIIRHQIGIQRKVTICGPKGIAQNIFHKLHAFTWNLISEDAITYEIIEMLTDQSIQTYELKPSKWELIKKDKKTSNVLFKGKDFEVTGILLDHKIPTLAYKFQENTKIKLKDTPFKGGPWVSALKLAFEQKQLNQIIEIDGKQHLAETLFCYLEVKEGDSLGIIMDHAASEQNHKKIFNHFYGTKQIFIECFYKTEDKELANKNAHSFVQKSAEIAKSLKAENITPVHFSRKYKLEDLEEIEKEFYQILTQ